MYNCAVQSDECGSKAGLEDKKIQCIALKFVAYSELHPVSTVILCLNISQKSLKVGAKQIIMTLNIIYVRIKRIKEPYTGFVLCVYLGFHMQTIFTKKTA